MCVFNLVFIRRLSLSKPPIDKFLAPHCCFTDINVIKISASDFVWEQNIRHCTIWPIFEECTLQKFKPPQLILLKVQPVFANFAEYPYPCPSFLPTSWEANKGLSSTLLGLWSPKPRSIHDSLLGLPSLHPVFGPFEKINEKSSNLTLWMGMISA